MIKKVKEMIHLIEADGWFLIAQEGSHKQYKHLLKKGKVTIPDHGANKDLDHKIVKSILIQAGLIN
jgi:predicted RNA binding protein YcfA (HicA-like mRNA interferase family)